MINVSQEIKVVKRNGRVVPFEGYKIINAIYKAFEEVFPDKDKIELSTTATHLGEKIVNYVLTVADSDTPINIEDIQDSIENCLMDFDKTVAKAYITYRYKRKLARESNSTDDEIFSIIDRTNEEVKEENSNKNPTLIPTQRDYIAGTVSKDITNRVILPKDIVQAHEDGIIHFHDSDYFIQRGMYNCCLINLEDMLQNGTVISNTMIERPHSFSTACTITTQIVAQVASNQYGGQSITLSHLAPFVDVSRQHYIKEIKEEFERNSIKANEDVIKDIAESRVMSEIRRGIQTLQYQIVTLMTTNGQSPFITIFMYLNEVTDKRTKDDLALIIEETIRQRYQGVKNEKGVWITPAFPKLIYVLQEDNIHENDKYYYLTKLAAKCSAKRLVPDYISEKKMKELKGGYCFPVMGCRSALSVWKDNPSKFYGRFNKGVVTINLVDVALSSKGDEGTFWELFNERLELCHRALLCRYERLKGSISDIAPILWQHGAISRLKKGETIDSLLTGGYSTISLGYAGLWECVYYMTHSKLTEQVGFEFGERIMKYMNQMCDLWNDELNLGFGIYGTPLESTTYKFAKCLQKRFGIIEGVTDKNYITNSYHIRVTEPINAFDKLRIESKFQGLSTGGAISYVEVSNLQNNIPAVLEIIKFIYDNIMYAEINTKSDYCQKCDFDGEIIIKEDKDGKLYWCCPNCGNTDENFLNVARRTCGYIGSNFWNQGRTQEIKERVLHLGDNDGEEV